ncbi:hypothetical protein DV737_g498, partial [Chaetothyriales sp. CBS 132003]
MSTPPLPPPLSPSLCFSHSALLAFLNSSRNLIDDSISTNLNALSTPSRTSPLSSSSTDPNTTIRQPHPSQRPILRSACDTFITTVLFPSWQAREQLLDYCTAIAQAPDPDDPDAAAREAYNRAGEARVESKNERLDPYSGRFFRKESRAEELAEFCERERVVEDIVRERSWGVVRSRCGVALDEGLAEGRKRPWARAFQKWRDDLRTERGDELD